MQTAESWPTAGPVTTPITKPSANPVLEQISARLRQSNYRQMRNISCDFRAGVAILQGRVCSFYAKQTAQELIRHIEGVTEIQNDLEVR